jgi:RND family efflux transporter MFP subunit
MIAARSGRRRQNAMAVGHDGAVVRQLRALFELGTTAELSDGQLLERFATDRTEAAELAFAVLVERHGPMVLRVCRSVLVNAHDAQDAFQATFLVLVKKARSLWVRDSLGPWLHQVAYRTASCARSSAARRRRHELRAATAAQESRDSSGDELGPVLHEEIERLPDRFRAPLVLCDLEGCSHEQAARHLGWPVGTVKSRQSRGRERLRQRLARRGLGPSAGLLAAALPHGGAGAILPPELVASTVKEAVRSAILRKLVGGSAVSLAGEVLRSMAIARWLKGACILTALGAAGTGFGVLGQGGARSAPAANAANPSPPQLDDMAVHTVKPGNLQVSVVESGYLEAGRSEGVYCQVEGGTTIIWIKPEGSVVKKGDLICELDSAALRDDLVNQRITTKSAEANYQNATLAREVAEIALKEYVEGVFVSELQAVKSEIAAAETAGQKAEERLERTRRAHNRLDGVLTAKAGARTPSDILAELDIEDRLDAAQQTIERERTTLKFAVAKRRVLEEYTRPKTIKALTADLETKRSVELARKATWELEEGKGKKLERQIMACTIRAPADGTLVYANDPRFASRRSIEVGATIRERQKIVSIEDLSGPMQVNVKVDESNIRWIIPKMRARVRVAPYADQTLTGTVTDVSPLPDAKGFSGPDRNVYTAHVRLAERLPELRPGMTGEVELLVDERSNVLSVPVTAVVHYHDKDHVAVKLGEGVWQWRVVRVGASNGKDVEIKQGLARGEQVIVNPSALPSGAAKREAVREPAEPVTKNSTPGSLPQGGAARP